MPFRACLVLARFVAVQLKDEKARELQAQATLRELVLEVLLHGRGALHR
jgi:hypothetical protein